MHLARLKADRIEQVLHWGVPIAFVRSAYVQFVEDMNALVRGGDDTAGRDVGEGAVCLRILVIGGRGVDGVKWLQ